MPARLGAFAVALVLAFGVSYAIGSAVGEADADGVPATGVTSTVHGAEHGG